MSVHIETDGPVTTVVIDRPEARNAVDGPTAAALAAAFRAFDADPGQSVAVLTGAGGTFCAGADLKAIGTPQGNQVSPVDGQGRGSNDGPMGPTRLRLGKPVIAAIEGYAVAGGLELAVWCDLRVTAEDATLGAFCRRWGVPLIDGGTVRLPRLVGTGGTGPASRRGARPPARRPPAGLPAQRPTLRLRPARPRRGGGAARGAGARHPLAEH
jgi:enoyl-CoA hydratase